MEKLSTPPTLLRSLHRFVVIGLFGLLGAVAVIQVYSQYDDFTAIAETLRQQHLQREKAVIQREVQRVVEQVRYRRQQLKEKAGVVASQRVGLAIRTVRNMLLDRNPATPVSDLRQHILDALAAIRFDRRTGYFFVFDRGGSLLMHAAQPQLVGRPLEGLRDSQGRPFVPGLLALIKQRGAGTIDYSYTKPGHQGEFSKVSYIEQVPELGWIIGTGVYLDELEQDEKADLLKEIQQMRFANNGYLFVDDWQGRVLAHGAQPQLVGQNIWDYQDSNGIKVVQQLIAAAQKPEGEFLHYSWHKPDTGEERPKVSFAMGIPEWQWMIGTGVYTDDIEASIADLEAAQVERTLRNVLLTLLGGGLIGLLSIVWIRRIYSALQRDLDRFRAFFDKAATSTEIMQPGALRFAEFRTQANHVNRMLSDKLVAEQRLQKHRAQLEQLVSERTERLEEKTRELEQLASTDGLTGLLNRRSFSERVSRRLGELNRYGGDCCLVLLDVDHFKAVNDRHGHATGDTILQTVAARLAGELREVDLLGRWGGEEFTLLLPQTGPQGALKMCKRMQAALSETPIGPVDRITASFGVTCAHPRDDLDTLVTRADQAMYMAKQAGRDRVEVLP